MRIAINCRSFLKRQYTGIGRYAYHLVKSLSGIDRRNEYQLYARKKPFSFNKNLPHFCARNFKPRMDWFNRGPARILKNIDIYHLPSPGPMDAPKNAKIVVTVHDVIFKAFPDGHTQSTIAAGEKQFKEIFTKASRIISCSKNTSDDLMKFFQVPAEKISLVYQGIDQKTFYPISGDEQFRADRTLKKHRVNGPYILSVGTLEPRKNLSNVIRAFHALKSMRKFDGKLVVIGMKGWLHHDIGIVVEKLGLNDDIVFLGYLSDRELRHFYNRAYVFIFPSFYEGFGFPIIEAFRCGVPVVTSNVSSCPEVAGSAALTVNPESVEDITDAVRRIINDPDLSKDLMERGFCRAEDFDFKKTAKETLKVYEEVYAG